MSTSERILLHGSCVELREGAVLLRGPSGAGKSDLALRLIDEGAMLVADDYVQAERREAVIWVTPPPQISGLIEIRGAGIVAVDHSAGAPLALIIDLVADHVVPRMPEPTH